MWYIPSDSETIVMLLIFFIFITFIAILAIFVDYMITKKSRNKNDLDVVFNDNDKNKKGTNVAHYIKKRLKVIVIIEIIIFVYLALEVLTS